MNCDNWKQDKWIHATDILFLTVVIQLERGDIAGRIVLRLIVLYYGRREEFYKKDGDIKFNKNYCSFRSWNDIRYFKYNY
jgi:hypothetical protein